MLRRIVIGAAAGAVGSVALNIVTYVDMAIRGRPASSTPAEVAGKIMMKVGVDLDRGGDDERAGNRRTGIGSLMGYVTGLGVGTLYGALRVFTNKVPIPVAGLGLGAAAMAGSDVPIAALGVSDPRTWTRVDWLSDAVPHLAYGIVTAIAYDALTRE